MWERGPTGGRGAWELASRGAGSRVQRGAQPHQMQTAGLPASRAWAWPGSVTQPASRPHSAVTGEPGRKGCPLWKLGLPVQDRGQAAGQRGVPVLPLGSATRTVDRTPVLCAHKVRTLDLWIQDVKVSEYKQVNPRWPRSPRLALVLS